MRFEETPFTANTNKHTTTDNNKVIISLTFQF